jgi:hypothetical protein
MKQLERDVRKTKKAAFATGTKCNLLTQWKAFLYFCLYFCLVPVPASVETVQLYIQFLSREFASVQSIKNYVNGVKLLHLYKAEVFPHIGSFNLNLMYRGLSRMKLHCVKQVLPITFNILLKMFAHIDCNCYIDVTVWCCFLLAFFMFARKSNMVPPSVFGFDNKKHLQRGDIKCNSFGLIVRIKWSKTIQFGERILSIPLTAIPGSVLCPVSAYINMCRMIPGTPSSPAFLIPQNDKFITLTYSTFTHHLKRLLNLAGINADSYSGHSFRRGGATAAFKAGVPGELIQLHGDWKSDAYLQYLNIDMAEKLKVSKSIALLIGSVD